MIIRAEEAPYSRELTENELFKIQGGKEYTKPIQENNGIVRLHFEDDESWLAERLKHLTTSELSVAYGCNRWASIDELFDVKTGKRDAKDISLEPPIIHGNTGEPIVRDEFKWLYSDRFQYSYHARDILYRKSDPYISTTLDGELVYTGNDVLARSPTGYTGKLSSGMHGVHEIKCPTVRKKAELDEWNDGIPEYYFTQVLGQLLVTGWDFSILTAKIVRESVYKDAFGMWKKSLYNTVLTNNYVYFASDPVIKESFKAIEESAKAFRQSVDNNIRPKTVLKF